MSTAVSVSELQRAWTAIVAGEFRSNDRRPRRGNMGDRWSPTEPAVVVIGAAGRVGASTVALAMATVTQQRVRILECAQMSLTGLASVTNAELGVTDTGWRRGNRGEILIERTTGEVCRPADLPVPGETDRDLTIVDASWDLNAIGANDSWIASVVETSPLVITTVASVPGLRALDAALHRVARREETWCTVIGPKVKKWPRALQLATTPVLADAIESGRLFTVPKDTSLALNGLTAAPLPPRVLSACRPVFEHAANAAAGRASELERTPS